MSGTNYTALPAAQTVIGTDTILVYQPENSSAPFTTTALSTLSTLYMPLTGAVLTGRISLAADVVITFTSTVTIDESLANRFSTTATANFTLATPLNRTPGNYRLRVTQDATGSRLITFGSHFKAAGGISSITLSTTANAVDYLEFDENGTDIIVSIKKAVA